MAPDLKDFHSFLGGDCPQPKTATLSSNPYSMPGTNCINGILDSTDGSESGPCHTDDENYPFLVVEYDQPVSVTGVKIYNRKGDYGKRTEKLHVIVTDVYPQKGEKAEGMNHSF